jgi:iron(III) transport system substrate-binding protein
MGEGLSTHIHGENGRTYPGERPIRLGPALLADSDQARRAQMLARWRSALADAP